MIPSTDTALNQDLRTVEPATRTFALNPMTNVIEDFAYGAAAMTQAIYLILNTERYRHVIYSWNYGVELTNLIGVRVSRAVPEIERRIKEALLWDKRIKSVKDFTFEVNRNVVSVTFTAETVFGGINIQKDIGI